MSFTLRQVRWVEYALSDRRRVNRDKRAMSFFEVLEERRLLAAVPVLVAGAAAGAEPRVTVLDAQTGEERFSFLAYGAGFRGGVRVAVGDINGDGTQDIVTAAGAGGGPHVRIFSGVNGAELAGFYAYHPSLAAVSSWRLAMSTATDATISSPAPEPARVR